MFCFCVIYMSSGIAAVEKDTACLSDVVEEFEKLKEIFLPERSRHHILIGSVLDSEIKKAVDVFKRRSTDEKITPLHLLANLLDPRYRGDRFKDDEMRMQLVLNKLEAYGSETNLMSSSQEKLEIGRQLTSYRNNDGLFGSNMLMDNVPHMYWNNLMLFKSTSALAQIAVRILSIPASSAAVERSFSIQGNLHTKSRNRLSEDNVDKLMRIKWCLDDEEQKDRTIRALQKDVVELPEVIGNIAENEIMGEDDVDIDEIVYFDEDETYSESELMELVGLN
jgi:hypothetical protein